MVSVSDEAVFFSTNLPKKFDEPPRRYQMLVMKLDADLKGRTIFQPTRESFRFPLVVLISVPIWRL